MTGPSAPRRLSPVERVFVVGGGLMGSGIAETVAVAGGEIVVREADASAADHARRRIEQSVERARARGKLSSEECEDALARIDVTTSLDAIEQAELIIEAVPEDAALKQAVMRELDERASRDAIIASNTSSIPLAQLASVTARPGRVCGMHFFSPVPVMPLVEVVRALDTTDATVSCARAFVESIGKRPIETKDRSGFIVNMLLVPYLMAAVRMYEDGFASREDIDAGMQLGCGHPMGPLTLCDFIGLDVLYAVCDSLYEEFKRSEYAPPPMLKRMLASGRFGRKSGRGFYDYPSAHGAK